jgi:hypothetical protein
MLDSMDASVALVAFGAFLGGLLVIARVTSWVASVVLYLKPALANERKGLAFAIAPLLLHSGPWLLVAVVMAVWYAASSSTAVYLWAVVSGLSLAAAFVGAAVALAYWRRQRPPSEPPALTPERFIQLRRRFFWRNSLFFAFAGPFGFAVFSTLAFAHDVGFLLIMFLASFAAGWVWSWFMWQWQGELLKVDEKRRAKRERDHAV